MKETVLKCDRCGKTIHYAHYFLLKAGSTEFELCKNCIDEKIQVDVEYTIQKLDNGYFKGDEKFHHTYEY